MSYYSRKHYSNDTEYWWVSIVICVILILLLIFGTNSCSASKWNDGICPDCEARYELRGASNGLKYYSCPDCGEEVERY